MGDSKKDVGWNAADAIEMFEIKLIVEFKILGSLLDFLHEMYDDKETRETNYFCRLGSVIACDLSYRLLTAKHLLEMMPPCKSKDSHQKALEEFASAIHLSVQYCLE